jgi:HEAT repeat protein
LSAIRRLVFDKDVGVRAAAAEAIGALSGPSGVPSLTPLLGDPEPRVRASALRALHVLSTNVGRPDIARNWTSRLLNDSDANVKALAKKLDAELD